MNSVQVIQRLHQHRAWVNQNLLTAAANLTAEQLRTVFQIGQGSIWMSLLHLYAAEFVWLETLHGNESAVLPGDVPSKIPGNQQGDGSITTLSELREKWSALERQWQTYLSSLTPEALDEIVFRYSPFVGKRFGNRRGDVMMHVCTHAQYTTAQVVNMFRQLGVEKLPDVMLIALARSESM